MLKWFRCPNGEEIEVAQCLGSCPQGQRCLTLPTLVEVGRERKWTGEGSTTQLLNGTMYEYLKLTNDFTLNPRKDKAFALLGTHHHELLEKRAAELGLPSEISLTDDERNVFDLLEYNDGEYTLTDYKTWGAFKVSRTLGFVCVHKEVIHYTDKVGKKRQRTEKTFAEQPEKGDWFDVGMQLGRYKMLIVDKLDITIAHVKVQVTVRDGGLKTATQYGINENMYYRDVYWLPERDEIESYFFNKQYDLVAALGEGHGWDTVCSEHENWDGARCRGYCEVWMHCPKGKMEKQING